MGPKHSKEDILSGALAVALEHGFSQLSYGRVAKHLDISDRTVVYYFASKDELLSEVLVAMGIDLQVTLQQAFTEPATNYTDLAAMAWPILATPDVDPVFALFFEANGLAAAGREPFVGLVPLLVNGWIDWASDFVTGPKKKRRHIAEAAIAMLDGLLLLRQMVGAETAQRAARQLGIA